VNWLRPSNSNAISTNINKSSGVMHNFDVGEPRFTFSGSDGIGYDELIRLSRSRHGQSR
jgi:hypothetical protein